MKKFRLFMLILLLSVRAVANDGYSLEDLDELLKQNIISKEEYDILRADSLGQRINNQGYYNLKINGYLVSGTYNVFYEGNQTYLDLEDFLSILRINFEKNNDKISFKYGEAQDKVTIELKNCKVFKGKERIDNGRKCVETKDGKIYLSDDIFKKLFLNYFEVDEENLKMSMYLSFSTPQEILLTLETNQLVLANKKNENEITYIGKRELFDLGYLRVGLTQSYIRNIEEKKYDREWSGNLDYQGPLLYGEFRTNYDMKNQSLNNISLKYADLWANHTLEITADKGSEDKHGTRFKDRSYGFRFFKDKGYYDGDTGIRIEESVPIGSKAELIYMGTAIAIVDEKDGKVVFEHELIKSDKTYELKIYKPNGEIYTKVIKTTQDFNRQNRHEYSYDISAKEDKSNGGRYTIDANVHYGFTDKLTLGVGLNRTPTAFYGRSTPTMADKEKSKYYEYTHDVSGDLIYGGVMNGLAYTYQLSGTKSLDDYVATGEKYYKKKYTLSTMADFSYNNFKVNLKQTYQGKYYDERNNYAFTTSYRFFDKLNVDYSYTRARKYDEAVRNGEKYSVQESLNFGMDQYVGPVLFTLNASTDLHTESNNSYGVSAYYNGFKSMSVRLENKWTNNGKNYETALSLYNNNFNDILDFSTELRYTDVGEKLITFKVGVDISDWVDIGFSGDDAGNRRADISLDRVFDLRNPKIDVSGGNVSRIYVTTFVDGNNNNIYDKGEKLLDGVEVTIGKDTVVTDKNGKATFYGMSNGLLYDLTPVIKKPHYALGDNKIKVISKYSSNVEAFIPVKPMIDISGYVVFDEELKLNDDEKEEFYSDVLIEIKDKVGNSLELVAPDNTGRFDVSGLIPEDYQFEVYYLGTKYNIPNMRKDFTLSYNPKDTKDFNYNIALRVYDKEFELLTQN